MSKRRDSNSLDRKANNMRIMMVILATTCVCATAKTTTLSNVRLPVDSDGNQMLSGETSVLKVNNAYYFYVNNWGGCQSVDCCQSKDGCASCCYVPPTEKYPDACVFTQNHSVYAYKTYDFKTWKNLGIVLNISDRPKGIEFRPHVVQPRPGFFVMWFENRPSPIKSSGYSIGTSTSPLGPFVTQKTNVDVSGITPGDFDVLIDGDEGGSKPEKTCWHVQTTTNDPSLLNGFVITQLDENCMSAIMPKKQVIFHSPKPAEGPVFFKRKDTYYILAGTTCCACRGGSSIYVFSAPSPLGPWKFIDDVGSNKTHRGFNPHSPYNYVTRAQASAVFPVKDVNNTIQYIWFGNQWTTSTKRNSDLVYWSIIEWGSNGNNNSIIKQFEWQNEISINLAEYNAYSHKLTP